MDKVTDCGKAMRSELSGRVARLSSALDQMSKDEALGLDKMEHHWATVSFKPDPNRVLGLRHLTAISFTCHSRQKVGSNLLPSKAKATLTTTLVNLRPPPACQILIDEMSYDPYKIPRELGILEVITSQDSITEPWSYFVEACRDMG